MPKKPTPTKPSARKPGAKPASERAVDVEAINEARAPRQTYGPDYLNDLHEAWLDGRVQSSR